MIKSGERLLSVIIPVYNEEQRIYNLQKIISYLEKQKIDTEIIVINDGSYDGTLKLLKFFSKQFKFRIISYKINRGKGFAIKKGMLLAKGIHRIFIDIDLSTPIEDYQKLLSKTKTSKVIIGSRRRRGSRLIVRQPKLREEMGQFFTKLSQLVLGISVSDFTCGFKYFHRDAAEKIFSQSRIERWGFDSEILYLAKKYGYSIYEVPVTWKNNPHTKVKFPQDIIRSFFELFTIRINEIRGLYK